MGGAKKPTDVDMLKGTLDMLILRPSSWAPHTATPLPTSSSRRRKNVLESNKARSTRPFTASKTAAGSRPTGVQAKITAKLEVLPAHRSGPEATEPNQSLASDREPSAWSWAKASTKGETVGLRKFFSRRKRDAEFAREIETHIAHEIDENLASGLSPEEAHRQAYLKFGSPRRVREEEWEFNTLRFIDDLWRDFRYSTRTLWRTPGFAFVAVIVMALGIGANTAIFTVVRSVLLKPLPFKDPDRLIQLYEKSADNRHFYNYVAGGMYAAWKKQSPSIEEMGIYSTSDVNLSDNGGELPERVRYADGSWDLFSTLGVTPEIGRFFTASEDSRQGAATVVLTHSLWERRYGGDRNILGKTIQLNSHPYTVIGVLPPSFTYPEPHIQIWTAIYHEEDPVQMPRVDSHNYFVVARLRPGASMAQALSEIDTSTKRAST